MKRDIKSVILFLIDGMRPDGLSLSNTPVIDKLIESGSSTFSARSVMPSVTLPCITSLFHAVTPETHGIDSNTWKPDAQRPTSLFSAVRSKERKTASICNWEELRDLAPVGSLDTAVYIDNSYDAEGAGDRRISEIAADAIQREHFTLTFVYLGHVDTVGHSKGYMSDEYLKAISIADSCVGAVLESAPENTAAVLLSDHGGHEKTHGADCDEDLLIPVVLKGPGIPAGHTIEHPVSIIDIAPTVMHLLGLDPPAEWAGTSIVPDEANPGQRSVS